MHAVVLAGGYATRLWPLTRNRPKMLLPVGESTVIDRILSDLEAVDRIDEVFVSTNERFAEDFEAHLADTTFEKPRLSIEESRDEDEKFGVVGALAELVEREGIEDEDLLVVAGDNIFSFDLRSFVDFQADRGGPAIAAYDVGSVEQATDYGVIDTAGERVTAFEEKPDAPSSTLVSIACYAFPAEWVQFREYLSGENNPDEPGWFIQWLVDETDVYAFDFDDAWFDIGTPDSYLDAVEWTLDGGQQIADTATVADSTMGPNVQILDQATVTDSHLERSVVFPDATITDCDIRESIIDQSTHVDGLDLSGALIGAHTHLTDEGGLADAGPD